MPAVRCAVLSTLHVWIVRCLAAVAHCDGVALHHWLDAPPPPGLQAFFLESLVVPRARQLGVAEEYE